MKPVNGTDVTTPDDVLEDREYWIAMRRHLLGIVAAIEERFGMRTNKRTDTTEHEPRDNRV